MSVTDKVKLLNDVVAAVISLLPKLVDLIVEVIQTVRDIKTA